MGRLGVALFSILLVGQYTTQNDMYALGAMPRKETCSFLAECQLLNLARKLLNGEAVSVGTVGGSFAQGRLNHAPWWMAEEDTFSGVLLAWMKAVYPPKFKSKNHTLHNRALSGTGSGLTSFCMGPLFQQALPELDLLLVEFLCNDSAYMETPSDMDYKEGNDHASRDVVLDAPFIQPLASLERISRPFLARGDAVLWVYHQQRNQGICHKELWADPVRKAYGISAVDLTFSNNWATKGTQSGLEELWSSGDPGADIHMSAMGHREVGLRLVERIEAAILHVQNRGFLKFVQPAPLKPPKFTRHENVHPFCMVTRACKPQDPCYKSIVKQQGFVWTEHFGKPSLLASVIDAELVIQVPHFQTHLCLVYTRSMKLTGEVSVFVESVADAKRSRNQTISAHWEKKATLGGLVVLAGTEKLNLSQGVTVHIISIKDAAFGVVGVIAE
jgi:hypothetical protein